MDPPKLALPGNLARSLRHLDDTQLEALLRAATAEARRRGLTVYETGEGRGHGKDPVSRSVSGPSAGKRAGAISPGLERVVRAALEAGVKPAAIARQFRLQRAEVQRIARSGGKG